MDESLCECSDPRSYLFDSERDISISSHILLLHWMFIIMIQEYGMTALAWAAFNGYVQVVDMLLKAGANPDLQDKVIAIV